MYYAHSLEDDASQERWHRLSDHLLSTAAQAAAFAEPFGCGEAARIAGLLHDLGKYTDAFQRRIRGENVRTDHSTAGGAAILAETAGAGPGHRIMAELIAHAILGHHAGLPDRLGTGGLSPRLDDHDASAVDPVWRGELAFQLGELAPTGRPSPTGFRDFRLSLLGRMIFSCLVDADFKDTETFYARQPDGQAPDRHWPTLADRLPDLRAQFDTYMANKASQSSSINALRGEILAHVRGKAKLAPGLFTLNVPTGGGKTLASLGFALDHAQHFGHRRIIYAIPFTSIIDQTAAIFRELLGEDVLLEHHSSIEEERFQERSSRDKLRLAMEDWAAPIVVTTNVQLFESLFAARPSRCRKLHNIAGSVIILDEAQTLPLKFLIPCVRAIDELCKTYGCTVVLCTATQPALDARHFSDAKHPLALQLTGRELAPDPPRLAAALKRCRIGRVGPMTNDELVEALAGSSQGLVIVNSRKHALDLYREAMAAELEGVVHLSTRQYAAHRRELLDDVRQRLKGRQPCRLIATSLVEAGVDVDFPRVWRAEAGLDQIIQAAGRCNREGENAADASLVSVFQAPDYPPPREIAGLVDDFRRMASEHDDLSSLAAIEAYFREVYWRKDRKGLDGENVLDLFKLNRKETAFSYRTCAERFRLIDSDMAPVIIAETPRAQEAVERLGLSNFSSGRLARDLQPFLVQVPPRARWALMGGGHADYEAPALRGDQFVVLKTASLYRRDVGLLWEDAGYLAMESAMV